MRIGLGYDVHKLVEGRVECIKYKECLVKKKDCKIS